jgi:hypothetical protein
MEPEKSRQSSTDAERDGSNDVKPVTAPPQGGMTFPEGGTRAWLTVLGAWCVMFFTFGYLNAFGYVLKNFRNYRLSLTHNV